MMTRLALAAAAVLISGAAMAQATNPSGSVVTTPGGVPLSTGVPTAGSPGVPVGSLSQPRNIPGASNNPTTVGGTEGGSANSGNDNGNGGSGGGAGGSGGAGGAAN